MVYLVSIYYPDCWDHSFGLKDGAGYGHFFFFQAEDCIRDLTVTGVQTCALPISTAPARASRRTTWGIGDREAERVPGWAGQAARLAARSRAGTANRRARQRGGHVEHLAHLWPTAEDRTRAAAAAMLMEALGASAADSVRTSRRG